MSDWAEYILADFADVNPRESMAKGTLAKKFPMDSLNEFQRKLNPHEIEEYKGGTKFRNRDTLLARITPCLQNGKTAFVDVLDDDELAFGSTEYIVLREKEGISDALFLYYLAISPRFRRIAIKSMTGSTGRQRVQHDVLNNQLFDLPPLPEQKAIAHILGKLDDKIELNRKMNETLEGMAQALFKSWFVDFDPVLDNALEAGNKIPEALQSKAEKRKAVPDHKKLLHTNPELARQFPDRFVFNDTLNKWMPDGWEDSTFGDEFNITMGQSPPGSTYNEDGIGKPFFQGKTDFGFRFPSNRIYCTEPKREAFKNDTLISVRAPVGTVNLAHLDCVIGRGLCAVRHRSNSVSYTYYSAIQLKSVFDVYEGEGTVFGSINQKTLKSIPIMKPHKHLIRLYDELTSLTDRKIELNTIETETLTKLRDTLLPQLISGKVKVPEEVVERFGG